MGSCCLLVQALFKLLVGVLGEDKDIGPENFVSGQRVARGRANALDVASGQRNVVIGLSCYQHGALVPSAGRFPGVDAQCVEDFGQLRSGRLVETQLVENDDLAIL